MILLATGRMWLLKMDLWKNSYPQKNTGPADESKPPSTDVIPSANSIQEAAFVFSRPTSLKVIIPDRKYHFTFPAGSFPGTWRLLRRSWFGEGLICPSTCSLCSHCLAHTNPTNKKSRKFSFNPFQSYIFTLLHSILQYMIQYCTSQMNSHLPDPNFILDLLMNGFVLSAFTVMSEAYLLLPLHSLFSSGQDPPLKAPRLAPYASDAGGWCSGSLLVMPLSSGRFYVPDPPPSHPPNAGTQGRGGVKTWRAFAWSLCACNHLLPTPAPAGHLWSHQIWAKTSLMTEVFQFVLEKRREVGGERREEEQRFTDSMICE